MQEHILYTVVFARGKSRVKYAVGPSYVIGEFGRFDDPGEASQEFKIAVLGEHEYLDSIVFESRVVELVQRYQRDLAAFRAWQNWAKR